MNRADSGSIMLEGKPLRLTSNRDAVSAGIAYVSEDRLGLGVILPHGAKTWFVKLQGDSALAEREKPNFEAFVKSIRFRDQTID